MTRRTRNENRLKLDVLQKCNAGYGYIGEDLIQDNSSVGFDDLS